MKRLLVLSLLGIYSSFAASLDFSERDGMFLMEGEIVQGDSESFHAEVLKWEDPPSAFFIDSPGGSVIDAMSIGQFIRGSRIPVLTGDICASACIYIYVAGVQRTVFTMHGRIGLHRPRFEESHFSSLNQVEAEEKYKELTKLSRAYLNHMGVNNSVIELIHSTPSSEIHFLSANDVYETFGFRLPFYDEWLASICGRANDHDHMLIQSMRAWSHLQSLPKERIQAIDDEITSLVELAKPAYYLSELGKLDEALSNIKSRNECEEKAAYSYISPYFKSYKETEDE